VDLGLYDLGDGGSSARAWAKRHTAQRARAAKKAAKAKDLAARRAERRARKAAQVAAALELAAQTLAAKKLAAAKGPRAPGPAIVMMNGQHGRLTIVEMSPRRDKLGHVLWVCLCDCGWKGEIRGSSIRYGMTRSCGCLAREVARRTLATPKRRRTPIRILSNLAKAMSRIGRHRQARSLRNRVARLRRETAAAWQREYRKQKGIA
jgi:hypothetical protein